MAFTLFFSWQSDYAAEQEFIERALNAALERIVADATVEPAVRHEGLEVDRDTKGVGGMPPIVETIFSKIGSAAIFVPDVTFVAKRSGGRPSPNPNVLIEYGWALKTHGHGRILPVMNSYYGRPTPESMPFDMRHLRFPIEFNLPPDADAAKEQQICSAFSLELEKNLRIIISAPLFAKTGGLEEPFPSKNALARFRTGEPIGKTYGGFHQPTHDIRLRDEPSYWLNVRPVRDTGRRWVTSDLKNLATSPVLSLWPLAAFGSGVSLGFLRGDDGFATYVPVDLDVPTSSTAYVFETGEIWGIDTYYARVNGGIMVPVGGYVAALDQYRAFLKDKLKIDEPYYFEIGIDRIKNEKVWLPQRPGRIIFENPTGSCVANTITHHGIIEASTNSRTALRPFFEKIFDKCGVESPGLVDDLLQSMV